MEHERSPEGAGEAGGDRKRRRKVLSCMDCRRRKVQCDRKMPVCTRCEKAGKPCNYEDETPLQQNSETQEGGPQHVSRPQTVTISKEVWNDMLSRLLQQERTIERLQHHHASPATPTTLSTATTPGGLIDNGATKETILFRGKGFKSFYYGPTDARSTMTLLPDAHNFFREEVTRNPELVRCRRDVHKLRAAKKILERDTTPDDLTTCLPERSKTDVLMKLYFDNIDSVYGFVHAPSFYREYDALWRDPLAARPAFVALVLMMVACCQCLIESKPRLYKADSPLTRETCIALVQACEAWLAKASQKHVDASTYQVRCLLLVAKQAHFIKAKRHWQEAGNLFRIAISAGLHRNTDLLPKRIPVFDQEMRRRIWAFIVEWDLQISIDRGMPALYSDIVSDCGSPSNLHDTDFDESTIILPASRPLTELTKMTYMCISVRSRSLRRKVTTLINQPAQQTSYEDVLSFSQDLELSRASLPEWTGLEPFDQGVALLHIQIDQLLLLLHARAAHQALSRTHATYSKQTFISAAGSILNKLLRLFARNARFLIMVRSDVQRIFTNISTLGNMHDKDMPTQESRSLMQPNLELAGKTLDLFVEKILATGGLQWTHTFVVFDHAFGRNMGGSRPGSEKISTVCKTILENQEPNFAEQAALLRDCIPTPKKSKVYPQEKNMAPANTDTNGQMAVFANPDILPSLSYSEILDWNFDDWMLMFPDAMWQSQNMSLPSLSEQNL